MSEAIKTKVLVIGGGPGGYVAAIRAGQLGLETVLMGAVLEDVGGIIHTHPTQSEAIFEASLKALGHAIHI